MNQEITGNPLENSVYTVMQPEKCFVIKHLEEKLPGHPDRKIILSGNPCYPACTGHSAKCQGHQWNRYITSEIAMWSFEPLVKVSPKAIEQLDDKTCTWLLDIMYRSLTQPGYIPNGEVKSNLCPKCSGHNNRDKKPCNLYMERTSGLEIVRQMQKHYTVERR